MSVVTITNRVTNPKAGKDLTNWSGGAGGGTPALTRQTSGGPSAAATYGRATSAGAWTYLDIINAATGTNAVVVGTSYTYMVSARASIAGPVVLYLQWLNSSGGVITTTSSTPVTGTANTWGTYSVTGTAPAGAVRASLIVRLNTAAASGTTWDVTGWVLGTGATSYFDGSYVNAASIMYAWTGAVDASTSSATLYTPALALVAKSLFDPTPRVEITLTDLTPTTNTVTIWRTADGKRQAVRGFRKRDVVGSDFVIDYEVPLGRAVTYDVEVTSGLNSQVAAPTAAARVDSASGAIQDPLVPSTTVPVWGEFGPDGQAYLRDTAVKQLEYAADMSIMQILGSPDPVALMGQRMSAAGVDMSMSTRAAQHAANLRNLLKQAPLVLVRPLPQWSAALPGLCYLAAAKPTELPVDEAWGGKLIRWQLVGDLVAAPTMNVLVPLWTYGDVKNVWATYQQAQTALSGKTYLDVLKSPAGM